MRIGSRRRLDGYNNHRDISGTLTNLTNCTTGTRNNATKVGAVHASPVGALG